MRIFPALFRGTVFLALISAALAGEPFVSRMRPMLGTYVEITVEGLDEPSAERAIEAGFAAIDKVDRLLSSHRADSELNAINAAAGDRAMAVSPWTYECIDQALKIGGESDGAFDITCRPILDLWGFVRKEYRLPSPDELAGVLPLVDYRHVLLLENNFSGRSTEMVPARLGRHRIYLSRPGMKLDVGGIGKGFAADKATEAMQVAGVTTGLVRVGGEIRGFGPRKWKVGIANPANRHLAVVEFEIQDEAVSTSGDYENRFEIHGRRYAHIVDPRTGWPVPRRHSVSVRAPTATLSDGWSTALFVAPETRLPSSIRIVDSR